MKKVLFLLLIATVAIFGCKKDDENENLPPEIDDVLGYLRAENFYDDVFKQVTIAGNYLDNSLSSQSNFELPYACATITITPSQADTWPKIVTLDFGSSNCQGNDGRNRRGKLIIQFANNFRGPECQITVTLQDYYVNDCKIEGVIAINSGINEQTNNLFYHMAISNGKVSNSNNVAYVSNWASAKEYAWKNGRNTETNIMDDEFTVTGTASGLTFSGKEFTSAVDPELNICGCCNWVRSGQTNLVITGNLLPIVINYGTSSSTCDDKVRVEVNGNTYEINIY